MRTLDAVCANDRGDDTLFIIGDCASQFARLSRLSKLSAVLDTPDQGGRYPSFVERVSDLLSAAIKSRKKTPTSRAGASESGRHARSGRNKRPCNIRLSGESARAVITKYVHPQVSGLKLLRLGYHPAMSEGLLFLKALHLNRDGTCTDWDVREGKLNARHGRAHLS